MRRGEGRGGGMREHTEMVDPSRASFPCYLNCASRGEGCLRRRLALHSDAGCLQRRRLAVVTHCVILSCVSHSSMICFSVSYFTYISSIKMRITCFESNVFNFGGQARAPTMHDAAFCHRVYFAAVRVHGVR